MGEGDYPTDQLDEVVHPTLGKLKFPKAMPPDERNSIINEHLNKPGYGTGEVRKAASFTDRPMQALEDLKNKWSFGMQRGGQGEVAPAFSPHVGGAKLLHATGEMATGHPIRALNEGMEGAAQVMGPAAAIAAPEMLPSIVPNLAVYGSLNKGIGTAGEKLGMEPENAQALANIATLATPGIKESMSPIGKFAQRNAGPVGRTAAIGAGAYEAVRTGNPWWLLAALPRITRTATEGVRGAGKLINWAGEQPVLPHEVMPNGGAPEAPVATDNGLIRDNSDLKKYMGMEPNFHGPEIKGLLPRGPVQAPPVPEAEQPMARPAAKVVTRGKGGRMTRQYTTGEEGQEAKPAWQPPEMQPKSPPQVKNGKLIHGPEEQESDLEQARRGAPTNGVFSYYTDEGLRKAFNIPDSVNLDDLIKSGTLTKTADGMYELVRPIKE